MKLGLRQRIIIKLVCYTMTLSVAVTLLGYWVNEHIESLVWESMLQSETSYINKRLASDPDHEPFDSDVFHWYDESRDHVIPPAFRNLPPGMHDEIVHDGKQFIVLVQDGDSGKKRLLALEITDLENDEQLLTIAMVSSSAVVILLLVLIAAWDVNRLIRPLSRMTDEISALPTDGSGRRIQPPDSAPREALVIAQAINDYMERIKAHGDRERNFINMASHELRTPISVISGAMEVALSHPDAGPAIKPHLLRASRIAHEMEELVTILLALARDPNKLRHNAEALDLREELPVILENHQHLCHGKQLSIALDLEQPMMVEAPAQVLRVAVGNLIRNAIENSDVGVIRIYQDGPSLVIADPGHGMTAREMSTLYTAMAKSGARTSGGIGLDLISRICQHYGWHLAFESSVGRGTKAMLTLR